MPFVFARLGKFVVIIALVATTGLHWAALQTVAWTAMLASNLCSDSFSMAVSKTFDGKHLCPLCKAIAAGKKSQRKNEFTSLKLKQEFPPVAKNSILIPPAQFDFLPLTDLFADFFRESPPTPPPRGCFV